MSKRPVVTNANDKWGALPHDDQEMAETPDELRLPKAATPEQRESARRDEQLIDQFRDNLAKNLRRLRARENWTQTDLGNKVGLGQSQIGFFERKRQSISLKNLIQFATVFNVDPMALLSGPIAIEEEIKDDTDIEEDKDISESLETAWAGTSLVGRPNIKTLPQVADDVLPEEAFFGPNPAPSSPPEKVFPGPKLAPSSSPTKSAESSMPMEAILGSPSDPLDLAVVSRIIGAAYKRIESLRHKHGSVPMTRAMLNSVLAAVLNASHDTDDECGDKDSLQPEVER